MWKKNTIYRLLKRSNSNERNEFNVLKGRRDNSLRSHCKSEKRWQLKKKMKGDLSSGHVVCCPSCRFHHTNQQKFSLIIREDKTKDRRFFYLFQSLFSLHYQGLWMDDKTTTGETYLVSVSCLPYIMCMCVVIWSDWANKALSKVNARQFFFLGLSSSAQLRFTESLITDCFFVEYLVEEEEERVKNSLWESQRIPFFKEY